MLLIIFTILFGSIYAIPDAKAVAEMSAHPSVSTPFGYIHGSTMKSRLGRTILAFRGIPYAKPPIDDLRFQPPQPVEKWEETLEATKDGPACPQDTTDPTSENCLLLNVYSTTLPKGDKNPKRPVIVYFHAGGFYYGSGQSTLLGPQYFMDREIVLVTPNYRLGSLGFLSLGTSDAPGNNGLKDQVQALKWVKQNIESFGGDPDLVTIVGYSAGSMSVTLHMVSPMSKGLFHRAIAMSGSAAANWQIPKHQLDVAKKQASLVGCPDTDATEIIKCLKTTSAEDLGKSFPGFKEFGVLVWKPVIEPDFGQERFLIEDPTELFHKGKHAQVPFMTGITADEFGGYAFNVIRNATLVEEMNENFDKIAPIEFLYEPNTNRSKYISNELKQFYFNNKDIDNTSITPLAQLYADSFIGFGVHRVAELTASTNNNPVYYYKFNYKGRYSHFYIPDTNNTVYGTVHEDDLIYLFHISKKFPMFKETDPESKIIDHLTSMWANFARTGNPTPQAPRIWSRLTAENKKYLNIDTTLRMEVNLYGKRYGKWDELFPITDHEKQHHIHANHS